MIDKKYDLIQFLPNNKIDDPLVGCRKGRLKNNFHLPGTGNYLVCTLNRVKNVVCRNVRTNQRNGEAWFHLNVPAEE